MVFLILLDSRPYISKCIHVYQHLLDGQRLSLKGKKSASGKTGKIILILFRQIILCLLNYHNDSSAIPVTFSNTISSIS